MNPNYILENDSYKVKNDMLITRTVTMLNHISLNWNNMIIC